MEKAVQTFALVHFLVIGLSHVLQPRAWVDFFTWLRKQKNVGAFLNGFLSLGFGSIVVAFHDVWSGIPLLLTLYGWASVLKALVCFTAPRLALRSLDQVSPGRSWRFVLPGAALLALAGLLAFDLWVGSRL